MLISLTHIVVSPGPLPAARTVCSGAGPDDKEDELDTGIRDLDIALQQLCVRAPWSPPGYFRLLPLGASRVAFFLCFALRVLGLCALLPRAFQFLLPLSPWKPFTLPQMLRGCSRGLRAPLVVSNPWAPYVPSGPPRMLPFRALALSWIVQTRAILLPRLSFVAGHSKSGCLPPHKRCCDPGYCWNWMLQSRAPCAAASPQMLQS